MIRSTRPELAAAYAGIMGVAMLNVLPALAGVLVTSLGWSEQQVGRFAAADSVGALAGTLIAAAWARSRTYCTLSTAGLSILAVADLGSGLFASVPWLLTTRLVGGLGGGIAMGVSFSVFAAERPERGIAIWSIGQLVFGFIAITVLPALSDAFSWRAGFFCLAALIIPGLIFVRWLSGVPEAAGSGQLPARRIGPRVWLGIAGVGLFYLGQGSLWPYLEVIGFRSGIDKGSVEISLSLSAASAILGSLLVLGVGSRFGRALPAALSFIATLGAIAVIRHADPLVFRMALAVFTFCWPIFAAYQFAIIATASASTRVGAFVTTANFAGLVLGPLAAGELIGTGGFRALQSLAMAMDSIALLSLVPLLRRPVR